MKSVLILLGAVVMLLSACVSSSPKIARLPAITEPLLFHIGQIEKTGDVRQSLLVVETVDGDSWRWIQSDALGAPLARQILQQGQWRNDGFLPPNPTARKLFVALLPLISAQEITQMLPELSVAKEDTRTIYRQSGHVLWVSEAHRDGSVLIRYPDAEEWMVKALSPERDGI